MTMVVRKFAFAEEQFELSPGQTADVFVANLVDERDGVPITIAFVATGQTRAWRRRSLSTT
jgi:ethanolamine utilization protein EutQ (cupin superfamily)